MRQGLNPQKAERKITLTTHHRIVIVVYIPNEEGFYKDSFDVFKMCLDSLVSTINSTGVITVVNNGSNKKTTDLLSLYLEENKIDTLILHKTNIGKIDALIGAARGVREKYITLTDADILFINGWQEKIEEVFCNFPDVGSVSPIPVRKGLLYGTSTVLKHILMRKIKFGFSSIPENFSGYNRYLESINWDLETSNENKWPVVENKGVKAIIGSGHQVLTIDRDILFKTVPTNPSLTLVGGSSEYAYVDEPIDKAGKLRLSTYNNYAFHMGNKLENWMTVVQKENIEKNTNNDKNLIHPSFFNSNIFESRINNKFYVLRKLIIKKIFSIIIKKK